MANKKHVEKTTEELVQPIIDEHNFELVDVEFVKEGANWYLKIFIDKEGGIFIQDCETVSRALDVKLEEIDLIDIPYILEVSSPGLDRPLKKDKDFIRNMNKMVELKLFRPMDGEKEFVGELVGYEDKMISVKLEDEKMLTVDKKDVAIIRLAVFF